MSHNPENPLWIEVDEIPHTESTPDPETVRANDIKVKALEIGHKLNQIGFDPSITSRVVFRFLRRRFPDMSVKHSQVDDGTYLITISNGDAGTLFEFGSPNAEELESGEGRNYDDESWGE